MLNLFNFNLDFSALTTNISPKNWFKRKLTKENISILFIDDEKFPIVDNLANAGWSVERIKDLINPQDEKVKRANIIFVDYKGVGRHLAREEEGIGLIKLIKQTYGKSKRVILYSGYGRFSLGSHLNLADNQMSKESDTYEFIKMIESEMGKL